MAHGKKIHNAEKYEHIKVNLIKDSIFIPVHREKSASKKICLGEKKIQLKKFKLKINLTSSATKAFSLNTKCEKCVYRWSWFWN